MTETLRDAFAPLAKLMDPGFIDASSLANILGMAAFFPATFSYRNLLEIDLLDDAPGADFSLHIRERRNPLPDFWKELALPPMPAVEAFLAAWSNPASAQAVWSELWLEFDTRQTATVLAPSIFLGMRIPDAESPRKNNLALFGSFAALSAPLLRDRAGLDTAKHLLTNIDDQVQLMQAGAMLSRDDSPIRLCLRCRGDDEALGAIARAEWSGDVELVRTVLAIKPRAPITWLHLDAAENIGSKLGLDFFSLGGGMERGALPLLDDWLARGWCTAQKHRALADWFGSQKVLLPGFMRGCSHFKVTIENGRIKTKAYVWIVALPKSNTRPFNTSPGS